MYKLLLPALLALAPMAANAAISSSGSDVFSPDKGLDMTRSFDEQRKAIIAGFGSDQAYSEIRPERRRQVVDSLDRIAGLMGSASSPEQLSMDDRVAVFNEQERINVLLGEAREDSRLTCQRESRVGTRRVTTHCLTVAERRRLREQAQDDLRTRQTEPANQSN